VTIEQTDGDGRRLIAEAVGPGRMDGTERLGGRTWTRYHDPSGRGRTLATVERRVTTVVTGTTGYPELTELAGALR
jgi:hypothetical protein